MQVIIRKRALNAILKASSYIEGFNTPGSGDRWVERIKIKINSPAKVKVELPLCKHPSLAKLNYSCYNYKDWVIVFRTTDEHFEVCRFIYGPHLY